MERNIIFSVRNDMVEGLIEISRTIRGLVPLGRPAHISTKKVRTNLCTNFVQSLSLSKHWIH